MISYLYPTPRPALALAPNLTPISTSTSTSTSPDIGVEFRPSGGGSSEKKGDQSSLIHTSKLPEEYRNSRYFRENAYCSTNWLNASTDIDMYGWVADSSVLSITTQLSTSSGSAEATNTETLDYILPPNALFELDPIVITTVHEFEGLLQNAILWGFDAVPPRLVAFVRASTPETRTEVRTMLLGNTMYFDSIYGKHVLQVLESGDLDLPSYSAADSPSRPFVRTEPRDKNHGDAVPGNPIHGDRSFGDGEPSYSNTERDLGKVQTLLSAISQGTFDVQTKFSGFWPGEMQILCVMAIDVNRFDYFHSMWTNYSASFDRANVRDICVRAVQRTCSPQFIALVLASDKIRDYIMDDAYLWAVAASQGNLEIVGLVPFSVAALSCAAAAKAGNAECMRILTDKLRDNESRSVHANTLSSGTVCAAAASGGHQKCMELAIELGWAMDAQTSLSAASGGHLGCLQYAVLNGCPWHEDALLLSAKSGDLPTLEYTHAHSGQRVTEWTANAVILDSVDPLKPWTANRDACRRYVCEHRSDVPSIVRQFVRLFTSK